MTTGSLLTTLCDAVRYIGHGNDDLAHAVRAHAASLQSAAERVASAGGRRDQAIASVEAFRAAAQACERAAGLLAEAGRQARGYASLRCGGGSSAAGGAGGAAGSATGAVPGQRGPADVAARIGQLRSRGHAVQRHLEVTDEQCRARLGIPEHDAAGRVKLDHEGFVVSHGHVDPATGTTLAPDGRPHHCGPFATRFTSDADFVRAADAASAARAPGLRAVELSIRDVLGVEAEGRMRGFYLDPAVPGGYRAAPLAGGRIVAIFRLDGTMTTMFPSPPADFVPS